MSRRNRLVVAGAAITAAVAIPGAALATGATQEVDTPITGTDLEQASEAALAHTGGGVVTETEVGDEESYFEVEVTLDDGTQTDVQLDEQFVVVGSEQDGESDEPDRRGSLRQ